MEQTKCTLLLVDGDAKSLRVLEVSLKKAGFHIVTARSGVEALQAAENTKPDLVISDTEMTDMDGYIFCRDFKKNPEWTDIPFIFLTEQTNIEHKIRGLELGVDDYLTKPIYIKEILTRVRILLQKRVRQHFEDKKEQNTRFTGQLNDMGVVDLIQTIEVSRKTGVIHFRAEGNRQASIFFKDGNVIDAEAGNLRAEDAVYRLLTWSHGEFEASFRTVRRKPAITISSQALLMEGMRRLDEWSRLQEQLPPLHHCFEVAYDELWTRLNDLPDEINHILRLFDSRRSLTEVIDAANIGDLEALEMISKLFFEGVVVEIGGASSEAARVIAGRPRSEPPRALETVDLPNPFPSEPEAPIVPQKESVDPRPNPFAVADAAGLSAPTLSIPIKEREADTLDQIAEHLDAGDKDTVVGVDSQTAETLSIDMTTFDPVAAMEEMPGEEQNKNTAETVEFFKSGPSSRLIARAITEATPIAMPELDAVPEVTAAKGTGIAQVRIHKRTTQEMLSANLLKNGSEPKRLPRESDVFADERDEILKPGNVAGVLLEEETVEAEVPLGAFDIDLDSNPRIDAQEVGSDEDGDSPSVAEARRETTAPVDELDILAAELEVQELPITGKGRAVAVVSEAVPEDGQNFRLWLWLPLCMAAAAVALVVLQKQQSKNTAEIGSLTAQVDARTERNPVSKQILDAPAKGVDPQPVVPAAKPMDTPRETVHTDTPKVDNDNILNKVQTTAPPERVEPKSSTKVVVAAPKIPGEAEQSKILLKKARRAKKKGDRLEALQLVDEALDLRRSSSALLFKSELLLAVRDYSAALEVANNLTKIAARRPQSWHLKGWAHYNLKEFAAARRSFERYLELAPNANDAKALRNLIESM